MRSGAGPACGAGLDVGPGWHTLLDRLLEDPGTGRVGVLGPSGTGKSTLARWLGQALAEAGPTGRVDADPGQSRIGPPAAIALGREPAADDHPEAVCFIGDVSPARNLLGMAAGVSRLSRTAGQLGLERLVLDPPGFLDFPTGHALHLQLIRILELEHLVVLDAAALTPVLEPLRRSSRPMIHELKPSPAVVERSRAERRAYREARFRTALKGARTRRIPARIPLHGRLPERDDDWPGRVLGLLDTDGFLLRLGVAVERRDGVLRVRTPGLRLEEVSSVEVGVARLSPSFRGVP